MPIRKESAPKLMIYTKKNQPIVIGLLPCICFKLNSVISLLLKRCVEYQSFHLNSVKKCAGKPKEI